MGVISFRLVTVACLALLLATRAASADDRGPNPGLALQNLKHIIVVMQENHSFDNYFGVLPYVPQGPYHAVHGSCAPNDHHCIDGLTCHPQNGVLVCSNSNLDDDGSTVKAFHEPTRCIKPDLD